MVFYILKILVTSFFILAVTEIAKINIKLSAIITALPITTLCILFWLYYEGMTDLKIASYIKTTLIFILPSIPMFLLFIYLINRHGFIFSIITCIICTSIVIYLINYALKIFNFKI